MKAHVKRFWHLINYNEDGSPLLDIPYAGPVMIVVLTVFLIKSFFF